MSGFRMEFDARDLKRFEAALGKMEKLSQRVVNKAAGKGATIMGRAVRAAAPRGKTKQLSKGFKRYSEKSRRGKKVFGYAMDPAKNEIFQKPIKNPGEAGGAKHPYAYYPASVEYGFLTRSKGGGLRYVPGQHFVRDAAEVSKPVAERVIMKTLADEMEKEWKKKNAT